MIVIDGDQPSVLATTNVEVTSGIDRAQIAADRGPAIEAARNGVTIEVADIVAPGPFAPFPELVAAAAEVGIASILSVPVSDGRSVAGAINLYGATPGAFGPDDREISQVLGILASIRLRTSYAFESASAEVDQLRVALASRDVIGQAKGILMVSHKVGPDEAFDLLRRSSQETNTKLRAVAEVVAETGELPVSD